MRPQEDAAPFHFATWNLGGHSPESALDLLAGFRGDPVLTRLQIVFLQEITTKSGPHFDHNEAWMLLHGKQEDEWRGCGIAFLKVLGCHESTRLHKAAISTSLRMHSHKHVGLLSGHVSHRFTIAQTAEALTEWGTAPCLRSDKVILGMDANETFLQPGDLLGDTTLSCTGRGEQILQWILEQDLAMPEQEMEMPSYFPYNTALSARRLDYVAVKGVPVTKLSVGSFRDRARSDHEPIIGEAVFSFERGPKREVVWCARELVPGCEAMLDSMIAAQSDLHSLLAHAAKSITRPANRSSKFRESAELKKLRHAAKLAQKGEPSRTAWKSVARTLQQERRLWKQRLAERAGQQDWHALRSLKHKDANSNWAAKLLDDPSWAEKLQEHMTTIFCRAPPHQTRSAMQLLHEETERLCKLVPWRPFTESEMRITMAKWKNHKATGPDGIALEALRLMFDHPRWQPVIAELLNDSLYRGKLPPMPRQGRRSFCPNACSPPIGPTPGQSPSPVLCSSGHRSYSCSGESPFCRTVACTNGPVGGSKALSWCCPSASWQESPTNGRRLSI